MTRETLSSSNYPKLVQEFARENFNLKILSALSIALAFMCVVTVAFLIKRPPVVVAIGENGRISRIETKTTDLQVQEAIRNYLQHRYSWTDASIANELKRAEFFVDSSLTSSFRKSMAETIRYVRDKHVSQRVYPRDDSFHVDLKNKTVTLVADRFTEFDALKAATEMKITLWFDTGDQTQQNPWGVYIEREQEGGK